MFLYIAVKVNTCSLTFIAKKFDNNIVLILQFFNIQILNHLLISIFMDHNLVKYKYFLYAQIIQIETKL